MAEIIGLSIVFQFHIGSIETVYSPCPQTVAKVFQFHYGTIETREAKTIKEES